MSLHRKHAGLKHSRFSLLPGLLLALHVLFAAACSSDESPGTLYLDRLAGVLEQDVPPSLSALAESRQFSPAPQVQIERPAKKLGVLELIDVHHCQLGPLVAARNGALGRVQTPSQRLVYDQRLIAGLEACESVSEALQNVLLERKRELPVARFNALFGGKEWHDFATPPVARAADETGDDAARQSSDTPVLSALTTLSEVLTGPVDLASLDGFEEALGELRFSRALGIQRQHWQEQARYSKKQRPCLRGRGARTQAAEPESRRLRARRGAMSFRCFTQTAIRGCSRVRRSRIAAGC